MPLKARSEWVAPSALSVGGVVEIMFMFHAASPASHQPALRPTRGSGDGATAETIGVTGLGMCSGGAGGGVAGGRAPRPPAAGAPAAAASPAGAGAPAAGDCAGVGAGAAAAGAGAGCVAAGRGAGAGAAAGGAAGDAVGGLAVFDVLPHALTKSALVASTPATRVAVVRDI